MMNEIELTTDLTEKILEKKNELNAVILAHYYQESAIQDIADFVGDSLELARKAKETHAEVIITMPIKERADAQKFILELKNNAKLAEALKQRIDEIDVELNESNLSLEGRNMLIWERSQLIKFIGESNK